MTDWTISSKSDLEVRIARTVWVPELDSAPRTNVGELELLGSSVCRTGRKHAKTFPESEAKVLAKVCLPGLTQTCPWTALPGNILILSSKVEKGSYYLTHSLWRRGSAMIESSGRKMRPKKTTRLKFVCTVTFILFVFVCSTVHVNPWECVCVCACVRA